MHQRYRISLSIRQILLFGKLTDVDPLQCIGVAEQLVQIQLNRTAAASDGWKHGFKAFHADIKIDRDAGFDAKGADAAYWMTYHLKHFFSREHLGLEVELVLKLVVINTGVAVGKLAGVSAAIAVLIFVLGVLGGMLFI